MKNLYLIRHSDAEKASSLKSDFDRELTSEGKKLIHTAATEWKILISKFDIILTSPLVRAVQTSEIIAQVFNSKEKIVVEKRLSSGCKPDDFLEAVGNLTEDDIAIVGHVPDLSIITSSLISSSGAFIDFKRAMIAKISFEGKIRIAKGILEFQIPAEAY